jgi:endonuclease/exonuclease/phosphatase family metal-dependent hydrolase
MRLVTLNLGHQTLPRAVPDELLDAIRALNADVVVFTEYVGGDDTENCFRRLRDIGLVNAELSDPFNYRSNRWHNQILIASREPIEERRHLDRAPDTVSRSNALSVRTYGYQITGLRVPAYETRTEWYRCWDWLTDELGGDIVIGDLNADLSRTGKRDRVLPTLVGAGGWTLADADGEWSYRGRNGTQSSVDHLLVRNGLHILSARYESDPFVPKFTDHAALIAEVAPR